MPEPGTGLLIVTAAAPTNAVEASHPSSRSTAGIERQVNIHGGGQQLGRVEQAIKVYQQVFDRYGDDPARAMREQAAASLYNMGYYLGTLGRAEEAVAAYRQLIDRYGNDLAPSMRTEVGLAIDALDAGS